MLRKCLLAGGIGFCALYLLNPGFGVFELIPDNLPFIGNLDEGAAVALLLHLIRKWRAMGTSPGAATATNAPKIIDIPGNPPRG